MTLNRKKLFKNFLKKSLKSFKILLDKIENVP